MLGGLHMHRAGEGRLLATVVEVQVGQDHGRHVPRVHPDAGQRVDQRSDPRPVPAVDGGVADADAGVHHDGAVRVPHDPAEHGERLERGIRRMPLRHGLDHRQQHPLDARHHGERHRARPYAAAAPSPPPDRLWVPLVALPLGVVLPAGRAIASRLRR
jgi:hypothetical protein